ncbi:MAG: hypothetical protein E7256_12385 [Lachnospiraceae bacterium]|nr:hypothetical protein [Lachnospiraceae bacterium]
MYQEWLEKALVQYDMQGAEAQLIRHNENMTFQVAEDYLLRIHKHADVIKTDSLYEGLDRLQIYKEELAFLAYLKNRGMEVQVPVRNKAGELVSMLTDTVPATMLSWIPGHAIEKSEVTPKLCYEIGEMVGRLHCSSQGFYAENVLRYDDALCERLKYKLSQAVDRGDLDKNHTRVMTAALDTIAEEMKRARGSAIMVHADLSLSNILITESGLVPIDFSLLGYGHPMMDIGELYCNINGVENRAAIAKGYQKAGKTIDFHALDCCFALNILLGIVLHCDSWANEEWFANRMVRWCSETFGPLGEGKPLISPEFRMLNVK